MQNNSNFEPKGNLLTNPKWKIKNSNIYINSYKRQNRDSNKSKRNNTQKRKYINNTNRYP